jgi:hypothetical protein
VRRDDRSTNNEKEVIDHAICIRRIRPTKPEGYARWKYVFSSEEGVAMSKAVGLKSYQLFKTDGNPKIISYC